MHDSLIKCTLSESCLISLCAATGLPCDITGKAADALKIDANVNVFYDFGPKAKRTDFTLVVQLKATSKRLHWNDKGVGRFEIDSVLYNKFKSTRSGNLLLLVVLSMPDSHEKTKWHSSSHFQQAVKGGLYWVSLYGAKDIPSDKKTVTISVKKKNLLTTKSFMRIIKEYALTESRVAYED